MVDDAFARLGLERKAMLDADRIRQAFQKAAAACHPDGGPATMGEPGKKMEAPGTEAAKAERTAGFQLVNEAAGRLTPVASRLKHLLELEHPEFVPPRSAVMDEGLVSLFTMAGAAVTAAADWVKKNEAARTALARAALTAAGLEIREKLEEAGAALTLAQEALIPALEAADNARRAGVPDPAALHALAQRAAFLEKWQAQVRRAFASLFAPG